MKQRFHEHPANTIIYESLRKTRFEGMRYTDFGKSIATVLIKASKGLWNGLSHKKRDLEEEEHLITRDSSETLELNLTLLCSEMLIK